MTISERTAGLILDGIGIYPGDTLGGLENCPDSFQKACERRGIIGASADTAKRSIRVLEESPSWIESIRLYLSPEKQVYKIGLDESGSVKTFSSYGPVQTFIHTYQDSAALFPIAVLAALKNALKPYPFYSMIVVTS